MDVEVTLTNVEEDAVRIRIFRCHANAGGMGALFGGIAGAINQQKPVAEHIIPVKHLLPRRENKSGCGPQQTFPMHRRIEARDAARGTGSGPPLGNLVLVARKSSFEFTNIVTGKSRRRAAGRQQESSGGGGGGAAADGATDASNNDDGTDGASPKASSPRKQRKGEEIAEFDATVDYVCEVRTMAGTSCWRLTAGLIVVHLRARSRACVLSWVLCRAVSCRCVLPSCRCASAAVARCFRCARGSRW